MNVDFMQTHLIPILYLFYALLLQLRRPPMGANWAFNIKSAQKSEAAWRYTQNVTSVYCVVSAAILLAGIYLFGLPDLVQIILEVVLVALMFPAVNGLVKRKFPG